VVNDTVLVIHIDFGHNNNRLGDGHVNYFCNRNWNMLNLSLFDFDFGDCVSLHCCLELIAGFGKMFVGSQNLLLFSLNLAGVFLFKINTDLVVDK